MIRWGVVSTGRIAQQFAADFAFVENGRIVAAGKAVLCEKPITVDPGQCEQITAAAGDASI